MKSKRQKQFELLNVRNASDLKYLRIFNFTSIRFILHICLYKQTKNIRASSVWWRIGFLRFSQ